MPGTHNIYCTMHTRVTEPVGRLGGSRQRRASERASLDIRIPTRVWYADDSDANLTKLMPLISDRPRHWHWHAGIASAAISNTRRQLVAGALNSFKLKIHTNVCMRMCMYMGIYAHLSRSKYETARQRISNVLSTSTCIIYVHVHVCPYPSV